MLPMHYSVITLGSWPLGNVRGVLETSRLENNNSKTPIIMAGVESLQDGQPKTAQHYAQAVTAASLRTQEPTPLL